MKGRENKLLYDVHTYIVFTVTLAAILLFNIYFFSLSALHYMLILYGIVLL